MKIEGQRVLITGASSGIGLALSFVFARKGAILALASRRFGRLKEVAQEIYSTFYHIPKPLAIPCDVANRESGRRLIKSCVNHLGGIDILVNNAGISVYGNTERIEVKDFHSIMAVNFFGALHCMLDVIPRMKKQGKGLIVNIASIAAQHGVPYLGAYCASKSALVAVSQSLRAELSKSGISIMIVYPDYTETGIFKNEKNVGGAYRPKGPYYPAPKVGEVIVKAIEDEKRDLFLSPKGRALALFQGLLPWLVEKIMQRIAIELREDKEVQDE